MNFTRQKITWRQIIILCALLSALSIFFYSLSRPAILSEQALTVREYCAQDYALSRNYMCSCIAKEFMRQEKILPPMDKNGLLDEILRTRGKDCINHATIREAAISSCRDYRAQSFRDVNCHCVGRAAIKAAKKAEHPLRHFTPMPKAAQQACEI